MSTLLHDWDEGSKSKRKKLLEWFYGRFDPTLDGGGLLESEYGADIALFLPRLLSWMQKTTASAICSTNDTCATSKPAKVKCFALAEQVACLHVFFGAANAHEYYREFQHADGLQLVLKIVAIQGNAPHTQKPLVSVTNRETLFRIILRISKMSRQCKEEISCFDGELAVIHGVLASGKIGDWKSESRVWTLCREILFEQLVGNPNGLDRAHEAIAFMLRHSDVCLQLFGAQVLRELISDNSFSFDPEYRRQKEYDLVPLCLSLLDSTDVYLQHESLELLHSLLQSKHLQEIISEKLVCLVGDSAKALDAKVEERFALIEDTTEHETYAHLRSAFTLASQAVNTLMNSNRNLFPIMVDRCGLLTPLAFVLVIERPHSLKWQAAAISIQFIISHHYRGAAALIGELFEVPVDDLLEWRDKRGDDGTMLAGFLLGDEAHRSRLALRSYQHRWYRPLSPRKQSDTDCVLNDIEQSVETAARDYVPELQVQTRVGGSAEEAEEVEILEAQRDHHLRVQLQKHFAQFRHINASNVEKKRASNLYT
ncbi:hypothetical protein JG687_00016014 [Phytophthora cactorum]|uniref:Armadillo-type fold n=1 Tax=Phytophthora cactorum TaxID=29920 RepID=A0A329REG0_9STRA|nr:hypothetical protein Pcac1_g25131 [Phytophthora cactorum]KAG6947577.1 hypothetical protein JG687_00016014 [Phytophthora cactorum]RAW22761.1 hypothetical protein PC110_g20802 [Phytophthora cactorum]